MMAGLDTVICCIASDWKHRVATEMVLLMGHVDVSAIPLCSLVLVGAHEEMVEL